MNWNKELTEIEKKLDFKQEDFLLTFVEKILLFKTEHSFSDKTLADYLELTVPELQRLLRTEGNLYLEEVLEILYKIGYDLKIKKVKSA